MISGLAQSATKGIQMGLDITAYKNIHKVEGDSKDQDSELLFITDYDIEWSNGFERGHATDLAAGYYEHDNDPWMFCAGSYSRYNHWRNRLAALADGDDFIELIQFADNEGVIGPAVSAKLAKDFAGYDKKAKRFGYIDEKDEREYFYRKFNDWRKAFETAAQNGCVVFQ